MLDSPEHAAAVVLLAMAVIVVVARLMGALFTRLGQPAVVGEILAGIALGPSLLGALPGDLPGVLFPVDVRPYLSVIASIGLVIFMFIVGLELDTALVRGQEKAAGLVAVGAMALPFVGGLGLALVLHRWHDEVDGQPVGLLPFALFLAASMAVTAFPVLARILGERGMHRTALGALVLAAAAVNDVLAWSLLAVVLAVASSSSLLDLPVVLGETVAFVAVMLGVVRPLLRRLVVAHRRAGRLTPDVLAVVLVGVLTSAVVTDHIGIHAIFGAFLFGAVMPREDSAVLFREILERLEQVSVLLLLPVFFIVTGLDVDVRGLGVAGGAQLALVLLVAVGGKVVGGGLAARAAGLRPARASAVGVLMNTRGLTELVILDVGREFGVLDDQLFTILVVMALVTTVMTGPLLRRVYPDATLARDVAAAERAALGVPDAYRVVVAVEAPAQAGALVDLAGSLVDGETQDGEAQAELVLSRFARPAARLELGSGFLGGLGQVTDDLGALAALAARGTRSGRRPVVRSQLHDDPAAALAEQARAVHADLLLVAAGELADRLLDTAPVAVAVLSGAEPAGPLPADGRPLLVLPGPGPDGEAALEVGVRLCVATTSPLLLVSGSSRREQARVRRLLRPLAAAGLDVSSRVVPEDGGGARASAPAGSLVVAGADVTGADVTGADVTGADVTAADVTTAVLGAPCPVLTVRRAPGDDGDGLRALLSRLAAQVARPSPAAGPGPASPGSASPVAARPAAAPAPARRSP